MVAERRNVGSEVACNTPLTRPPPIPLSPSSSSLPLLFLSPFFPETSTARKEKVIIAHINPLICFASLGG